MQTRKSVESIPSKIISKSNHKYIYKKTLINTKFQWLNKYLSTTQLKPLSIKNTKFSSRKNRHNSTSNLIRQNSINKNKTQLKTQTDINASLIEDKLLDMSDTFQLLQQININTQTLKDRCKGGNVLIMVRDFQGNLQQKFQKEKKKFINASKRTQNFFSSSKKQLSPHNILKDKIGKHYQNTPPFQNGRQNCNLTQIKQKKKKKLFMKTPQSQLSYIFRKRKNLEDFKVEPWKLDNEEQEDFTKF